MPSSIVWVCTVHRLGACVDDDKTGNLSSSALGACHYLLGLGHERVHNLKLHWILRNDFRVVVDLFNGLVHRLIDSLGCLLRIHIASTESRTSIAEELGHPNYLPLRAPD